MPTESKHTPEPWRVDGTVFVDGVDDGPARPYLVIRNADECWPALVEQHAEGEANAARIVACVNACAGMTDPAADIAALRAPRGPVFLAVYIATTNDTNGNPRRGWYVSRLDGQEVARSKVGKLGETAPVYTAWVEEGYNGTSAPVDAVARVLGMPTKTWNDIAAVRALVHETGRINVTPGEYRDARKLPRFGGGS